MLAARAPDGGAAADGFTAQLGAVLRTFAARFPAFVEQPIVRRIGIIPSDGPQGGAGDGTHIAPKKTQPGLAELCRPALRRNCGAPEDFIGHPVTDARKAALEQKHRFYRRASVSPNECGHELPGEGERMNFWQVRRPPRRRLLPMLKTDAPKLARVAENERARGLLQHEMIVSPWLEAAFFDAQFAAHSEVDPKPVIVREFEEHLFAVHLGAKVFFPNEPTAQGFRIFTAEDSLIVVQLHGTDLLAEPGIPALTIIFDLSQFRHGGRLDRLKAPCYAWRAWKK